MSTSSTSTPSSSTTKDRRPPRPSATLVVVRDAPVGVEVLLLRRTERGDRNSGAWVFPGGIVDAGDQRSHTCCAGLNDAQASAQLHLPAGGGLDFYVAAVRECFEESGLLFAYDTNGELLVSEGEAAQRMGAWRGPLNRGERSIDDFCQEFKLRLAMDRLAYFSHWITPIKWPKRFDTRFFVAEAPVGQEAVFDATEMVEQRWMRPADALAQSEVLKLMTPTRKTLEVLARHDTVRSLLEWTRAQPEIEPNFPRFGVGSHGPRPVQSDEPAWAEIGHIDPDAEGTASYDLVPDVAVRLSSRVIRVTADNGSVMTGPGTNTYLIGGGPRNEWAVIDPGPLDAKHVEAVLAAAPGPIRWILVTHTHNDHSPGTVMLRERTGAAVYGRLPAHPEWQDATFAPGHVLQGGERIVLNDATTLRAIHTPGHASNHLCYVLEQEKMLFTGDHVMQLSTVVINPPDGDMSAYVSSLHQLLGEDLEWLAPGHGFLMSRPRRAIEWIIAHRGKREAKVVDALRDLGPSASIELLLAQVYDDVPQRMHGVATRSLKAHLFKLRDEGRAREESQGKSPEGWSLV